MGKPAPVRQDAYERAIQLALAPMSHLPPLARAYLDHLCRRVGMCIETCISAYATYAHVVEGLSLGVDGLYHPPYSEIVIMKRLMAEQQGAHG